MNEEKITKNKREISERYIGETEESHEVTDDFLKKKSRIIHLINSKLEAMRHLTVFCTIASISMTQKKRKEKKKWVR